MLKTNPFLDPESLIEVMPYFYDATHRAESAVLDVFLNVEDEPSLRLLVSECIKEVARQIVACEPSLSWMWEVSEKLPEVDNAKVREYLSQEMPDPAWPPVGGLVRSAYMLLNCLVEPQLKLEHKSGCAWSIMFAAEQSVRLAWALDYPEAHRYLMGDEFLTDDAVLIRHENGAQIIQQDGGVDITSSESDASQEVTKGEGITNIPPYSEANRDAARRILKPVVEALRCQQK